MLPSVALSISFFPFPFFIYYTKGAFKPSEQGSERVEVRIESYINRQWGLSLDDSRNGFFTWHDPYSWTMNQSLSHSIDRLSDRSFDTRIGVIWIKQLLTLSSKPLGASRARPKGKELTKRSPSFYNFWPTTQASPNRPSRTDPRGPY